MVEIDIKDDFFAKKKLVPDFPLCFWIFLCIYETDIFKMQNFIFYQKVIFNIIFYHKKGPKKHK